MWSGPIASLGPRGYISWSFQVFRGFPHLLSEALLPSEPGTATHPFFMAPTVTYCDAGPCDGTACRLVSSLDSSCLPCHLLVTGCGDQWIPQGLHWKTGTQCPIKAPAIVQTLLQKASSALTPFSRHESLLSTDPALILRGSGWDPKPLLYIYPFSQVLALQNWPV